MMRSIRKHASSWFSSRHFGSNEQLDITPTETPVAVRRSNTKTEFELTSLRTKQLLEKGKFQRVVEMLRELSRDFLLKCLESFPFKALNKSIPEISAELRPELCRYQLRGWLHPPVPLCRLRQTGTADRPTAGEHR